MNAVLLVALVFGAITGAPAAEPPKATPLAVGDTFSIDSKWLGEKRRLNAYLPPGYAEAPDARFPVLYTPDGGVAEDFLLEPDLFDAYIAFDPSLWWNNGKLVAGARLRAQPKLGTVLFLASSSEDRDEATQKFADVLKRDAPAGVRWHHEKMPEEKHATIYHPAALKAFRAVLKPDKKW